MQPLPFPFLRNVQELAENEIKTEMLLLIVTQGSWKCKCTYRIQQKRKAACMVNILKFGTFFLLSNKVLVNSAGIHKKLVRTANGEDPNQTASASDLGMPCLSRPF